MATVDTALPVHTLPAEPATWLGTDSISDASILSYNHAAERMLVVMDGMLKVSIASFLVVTATWILGLLPGAVKLL
jgi:hypothetical protein